MPIIRFGNRDRYDGEIHNGKAHGQGTMRYHNGDVYKGTWVHGERQGYGEQYYPLSTYDDPEKDGNWYKGFWKLNHHNGKGVRLEPDVRYEGTFKTLPDGMCLRGDGRFEQGVVTFLEANIKMVGRMYYKGYTCSSTFIGKIRYNDDSVYIGTIQFRNLATYKSRYPYVTWHCGAGTWIWPNGDVYVGETQEGKREGQGTMKWNYGISETGRWVNDKIRGKIKRKFSWKHFIYQVIEMNRKKAQGKQIT